MPNNFLSYTIWGLISFLACKKIDSFPDKNLVSPDTKIIAHKGGGGEEYSKRKENTLGAARYGFINAEGIELDIQKSRDNTLWLYHDEFFEECDSKDRKRLPGLRDKEIVSRAACMGYPEGLTRLEDVFAYHRINHLDKKISLDVKSWLPTIHSEAPLYLSSVADEIIQLAMKYNIGSSLMVECENADFLNHIKRSDQGIECYLTTMGDFKNGMLKALKAGYTGLSFKYDNNNPLSEEDMELLHRKGLKIQFWTINEKSAILKALELKPDYLQTDNILLKQGKLF